MSSALPHTADHARGWLRRPLQSRALLRGRVAADAIYEGPINRGVRRNAVCVWRSHALAVRLFVSPADRRPQPFRHDAHRRARTGRRLRRRSARRPPERSSRSFEKLGELCSLPSMAQQVIQVAEDPGSDATTCSKSSSTDPRSRRGLMQVVNSAYCGLRNPVADLKDAVTMLGVRSRAEPSADGLASASMFGRDTPVGRVSTPVRLWDHSVCVATVCRLDRSARQLPATRTRPTSRGCCTTSGCCSSTSTWQPLVPRVLVRCKTRDVALPEAEREVHGVRSRSGRRLRRVAGELPGTAGHGDRLPPRPDSRCPEEGVELTRVVCVANYLATRYGRGSVEGRRLPAPPEGVLVRRWGSTWRCVKRDSGPSCPRRSPTSAKLTDGSERRATRDPMSLGALDRHTPVAESPRALRRTAYDPAMQAVITAVGPDHRGLADPIVHSVTDARREHRRDPDVRPGRRARLLDADARRDRPRRGTKNVRGGDARTSRSVDRPLDPDLVARPATRSKAGSRGWRSA